MPPQQASSYETPPLLRPLPPSNSTKNLESLCDVSCNLTSSRSLDSYVAPEATSISSNSVRTKDTRAASVPASKDVRPNSSDPTSHDKASTIVGLESKPTHNLVTATIGCPKSEIIKEKVEFAHSANPVDAAYSNGIGKEHTVVTGSSKVPSNSVASTLSDVSGQKIMTKDVDSASSSNAASTIAISMVGKSDSGDIRSHGNVQGSSPLCFNKIDPEVQPWRCRRTDGRKWRCRRDVIPNEKYCAMHMHRGAKKQVHNFQPTDLPSSKRSKSTHPHLNLSLPSKEKYTSLNTDLSISALEISRPIKDDEPSTTGNSSDATIYISDATICSSDDNASYEN